jgi:hypothetical protein
MNEHEGKVAQQIGDRGFYACVRVKPHSPEHTGSHVTVRADLCNVVPLDWIEAAKKGVALALILSGCQSSFEITWIHGMPCDTSPTVVAIAAMRAVWNAISFEPPAVLADRVEELIPRSHELSPSEIALRLCS